jgi:hypothetical protein
MSAPHQPSPNPETTATARATACVTVLLTNHQTAFIDEIAADIRRRTGHALTRSAMLRAIADAVLPYFPEWANCRSEEELRELVARRMRGATQPAPSTKVPGR